MAEETGGKNRMAEMFSTLKDISRKKGGVDEDSARDMLEEKASRMTLDDVNGLKDRLTEKIKGMKDLEEGLFWVGTLIGRAKLLWSMIRDKGFDIANGTKLLVGAGLLYFVVPADMLPDVIPGIGYIDDAVVLSTLWSTVQSEIERYVAYLHSHRRPIGDIEAMAFADGPPSEQNRVSLESLEPDAPRGPLDVASTAE